MKSLPHKIANASSLLILGVSVLFSVYLAANAWLASNETGAGAAQGSLGFYMILKLITPALLSITAIPYAWGLYSGRRNLVTAFLSLNSNLFYLNAGVLAWCWYFDMYVWRN